MISSSSKPHTRCPTSTNTRSCGRWWRPADGALRPARPADHGRAPRGVRRLLRAHGRARRSLRAARADRSGDERGRFRDPRGRRSCDPARARDAPQGGSGSLSEPVGRFPAGTPTGPVIAGLRWYPLVRFLRRVGDARHRAVRPPARPTPSATAWWQDYRVVGVEVGLSEREMPPVPRCVRRLHGGHVRERRPRGHGRGTRAGHRHRAQPPVRLRCGRCSSSSTRSPSACSAREIRRQYGFAWDPLRSVALHGGAEYVRRVLCPGAPDRFRMIPIRGCPTGHRSNTGMTRWAGPRPSPAPRRSAA